jgi:hypothetical protein
MTTAVAEETALVPSTGGGALASPLPAFRGPQMAEALVAYKELQRALDDAMPDQLMELDGKTFRKKGYWRAVARAFNLSVELVGEARDIHGALEDGSDNYVWTVTYRASTQSGAGAIGDGACAAAEKQRGRMKASEHNVRSHAHTRAFNRAVSNLVGFGEVSADELDEDEKHVGARSVGNGHTSAARTQAPQRKSSGQAISEAQRRRMYAIAKGAGWTDEGYRAHLKSHGIERDEETTRDVYEDICAELERGNG